MAKKSTEFNIGPYRANMTVEAGTLKEDYDAWKSRVGELSGRQIGIHADISLLNMIKNQGLVGRTVYEKGKKRKKAPASRGGGSQIITALDNMIGKEQFTQTGKNALKRLLALMEQYSSPDSKLNPQNIKYDDIEVIHTDEPAIDKDGNTYYKTEKKPVYGHYRTPMYVNYRNNYKEGLDKEEFDGEDDWWNKNPRDAKPPMWQALYGDGTGSLKIPKSLITIVRDSVGAMDEGEVEILPSTPVDIAGQGTAKAAYENFDEVKSRIDTWVREANESEPSRGGWKTLRGNFNTKRAEQEILNNPIVISLDSDSEQEIMRRIMGVVQSDYPANLTEVPIRINRNQLGHMATLAGFQPTQVEDPRQVAARESRTKVQEYLAEQSRLNREKQEQRRLARQQGQQPDETRKSWMMELLA